MTDSTLPGLITFGVLLAIALIGLVKSSAAAERLNSSGNSDIDANGRRDDPSRVSGYDRQ